jgi:signal transduction histidine kinase
MPNDWTGFDLAALATPELLGTQSWVTVPGPDSGTLEIGSFRLADGTLFQVGKSTESRRELLVRFRRVLLLDLLSVVLIAVGGGTLLTYSGLQPIRELTRAVRETLRTGQLRARVPVRHTNDALDELSVLFNEMLNRIEKLVAGMRGALDNVSHDLRTPMARLRGTAESALQAPPDQAMYREALAECLEESDRLVTMLNTLMDISEAETGAMRLDRQPLNLGEALRDVVTLYEDVAEEKGVTVSVTAPESLTIVADRNRLRQAFANLVDNAIKYNRRGGTVSLEAAAAGSEAVIAVTDTGVGIASADLPRIWERLYRADASRSERGLGLGLSLVKAIVEAHGGTITAESTPGTGTIFRLSLPLGAGTAGGAGRAGKSS